MAAKTAQGQNWSLLRRRSLGLIALNRLVGKSQKRQDISKPVDEVEEESLDVKEELKKLSYNGNKKHVFKNGDKYEGEWENGAMQGQGIYDYKQTGNCYNGEWAANKRHGIGTFTSAVHNTTYEGEWVNDIRQGEGSFTDSEGNRYEGEWGGGKMNGQGTYTFINGDVYTGEFKNNDFNGEGAFSYSNGDKYTGQWKHGEQSGTGTFVYGEHGHKYVGEWANDMKNGHGKYTAPHYEYEGQWKDDCMCGRGTYVYASGDRFEGEWKDDQEHGHGVYYYEDGSKYDGEWRTGYRTGRGVFTTADGARYEGDWLNNNKHGQGTYHYASGARYSGGWKDDQPHGSGTYLYSSGKKYKVDYQEGKLTHKTLINSPDGSRSSTPRNGSLTSNRSSPDRHDDSGRKSGRKGDRHQISESSSFNTPMLPTPQATPRAPSPRVTPKAETPDEKAVKLIEQGHACAAAMTAMVEQSADDMDPTTADEAREIVQNIMRLLSSALRSDIKPQLNDMNDILTELLQMYDDAQSEHRANAEMKKKEEEEKRKEEEEARRREEEAARATAATEAKARVEAIKRKKEQERRQKEEMAMLQQTLDEAKKKREEAEKKEREDSEANQKVKAYEAEIAKLKAELQNRPQGQTEWLRQQIEAENRQRLDMELKAEELRIKAEMDEKMRVQQDETEKLKLQEEKKQLEDMLKREREKMDERAKAMDEEQRRIALERQEDQRRIEEEREAFKQELERERETLAAAAASRPVPAAQIINQGMSEEDMAKMKAEMERQFAERMESMQGELEKAKREAEKNSSKANTAEVERLKKLYEKEMRERKKLYNEMIDMKGSIRVYVRVRPMGDADREYRGGSDCLKFPTESDIALIGVGGDPKPKLYEFDRVFPPVCGQEQVFEDTLPIISCVVDGYNVCIFAYGQTGAGKTFTMTGPVENPGIMRRALAELFRVIEERQETEKAEVNVSVLEIYNECIHDLLIDKRKQLKYNIKTDPFLGQYVENLSQTPVTAPNQIDAILKTAFQNRSEGKTNMNAHSSRSHMILYIMTTVENFETKQKFVSKLSLIDLAGSERIDKSGAVGDALLEAQHINKSLSALGDVISSLAKKSKHIPFRNSTLTHLLQDSLGGKAKTLMFAMISPLSGDLAESVSTLAFAQRTRGVELGRAEKKSTK